MKTQFLALLVVAVLAVAAGTASGIGAGYIQLYQDPVFLGPNDDFPDMWEYVYDVYGNDTPWIISSTLYGFDASLIVNRWPSESNVVLQHWDRKAANSPGTPENYGSYSTDGTSWTLHGEPWAIDNPWHTPSEYSSTLPWWGPGVIAGDGSSISFGGSVAVGYPTSTGLLKTLRVVHPYGPGEISWHFYAYGASGNGTILGPAIAPPEHPDGDVNRDFDVDVDDIDMLCDAIRTGSTNFDLFDISADGMSEGTDGFVDTLDLDFLVRFLVEISTSLDTGTEYGDFNLDGMVDTTDLTRLATNYGADDWGWDDGNANRYIDTDIDNTDLTILATYFGFGEPDVVPEPASAGLLLLGASAVLRRRRKAKR